MKNILITGATGFVGEFLCKELLEKTNANLYLLVRSRGGRNPSSRIAASFGDRKHWISRITVWESDVTLPELGLGKEDYAHLKEVIDNVYHCAASIRFSDPLEVAMAINHAGTKQILDFTRSITNPEFGRLNYISTAYIAGSITEGFSEEDLDRGQSFNNTYEKSKFECEKMIEAAMKEGVPITVYRPSVVTGHSETGETHKNNIIYKFLKLFSMGAISRFYCTEDSAINLVPVDYVVKAICCISRDKNCIGHRFHLVSRENVKVKHMITYLCGKLGGALPEFCSFDTYAESGEDSMNYFFEYVRLSHHFTDRATEVMLEGRIPPAKTVDEQSFDRLLDYCYRRGLIKNSKEGEKKKNEKNMEQNPQYS